ncbi:hypothetical protein RBQ61_17550 [Sedimentibacter sp. MB35-C1]|nr:hypothetical protein [Sedimentibacter sp. MB35-C1]WMJ77344.1 hypothetical protein RBQ61_17550 [Sedimentibacter sp. MB35-C1]
MLLIIGLIALLATGCTKQIEEIPNEEEIGGQETESEQEKKCCTNRP